MTFIKKGGGSYELARFCNLMNNIIYGGASRLLKYFKCNYEWTNLLSYADMRWSNGNVYHKLGFELDGCTGPNYWYWGKGITGRKHRLNYMKSSLTSMDHYDDKLTEFQIMSLEKFAWIYDCGHMRFMMRNR
jgi:hypothetical protein